MKVKMILLITCLSIASMLLYACGGTVEQPPAAEVQSSDEQPASQDPAPAEPAAESFYKVLHYTERIGPGDIPTLDPALAEDNTSHQVIEETFVGVTRQNELTKETEPGMATSWDVTVNQDGTQTITLHLRTGVPWVRWDGKQVVKVQDCDGKDRLVNADDFAYGIRRNLDPVNASPYGYLLSFVLKGANEFNSGTTTDFSTVGVRVVDPATLEMTFLEPAAYNLTIAGLWVAMPQPKWVIEGDEACGLEARGDRWTEPGFFQSYGPYTLKEWVHDSYVSIIKNPYWPGTENIPQAKIDEVVIQFLDVTPAFAEYEAGNIDATSVPVGDMDRVQADAVLSKELTISPSLNTYYYGFNTKAPGVDDARVRRALSLAIDRQSLIDNVVKGGQEPAQWFSRPGLAAAPTIEGYPKLGVKYDPEKAKAELQSYLDEKGLTADQLDITLTFNTNSNHQKIAEAIQQMWKDVLGVNAKLVNQEWRVYLDTVKSRETPQLFRLSWGQDYPDANNFIREVFAVNGSENPAENGEPYGGINWKNPSFEQLVRDAARESDLAKRTELYAQAENLLVYEDAAIIPIYWSTSVSVTKPYVQRTYSVLGGSEHFEKWDLLPH